MRSDAYFPCALAHTSGRRSAYRPTSVHKLRPGDIQVIASLGDSLSAGLGALARSEFQLLVENRGVAWSGGKNILTVFALVRETGILHAHYFFPAGGLGNWKEYTTLPNILKNFNPKIYGYSTRNVLFKREKSIDAFNVAVSGATSGDLPAQAKRLIQRMRQDRRVNYTQGWKMVTIMIGGNDGCSHVCESLSKRRMDASPSAFIKNLRRTLDILQRDMPRTFINLVPTPGMMNPR